MFVASIGRVSAGDLLGLLLVLATLGGGGVVFLFCCGRDIWRWSDHADGGWGYWSARLLGGTFMVLGSLAAAATSIGLVFGGNHTLDVWRRERAEVAATRKTCAEVSYPQFAGWVKAGSSPEVWSPYGTTPMKNRTLGPAAKSEYVERCVAANLADE